MTGGAAVMSLVALGGTPPHLMGVALVWCVAAFYGLCRLAKSDECPTADAPLGK